MSGEAFSFTSWGYAEPNNFPLGRSATNIENALGFIGQFGDLMGDHWNDYPAAEIIVNGQFAPRGYIVEWTFFAALPKERPSAPARLLWAGHRAR